MPNTMPPGPDFGAPQQLTRATARTGAPRTAFVLSLLSAIGVAVAAVVAPWPFTDPNLGFQRGADIVIGVMVVLGVSLTLAILGLVQSLSWRRAGGRARLNTLSIALAILAIVGVATGFVLFLLVVAAFLLAFSEI